MNGFIKRMAAAAAALMMLAALAGCAGRLSAPNEKNKATESAVPSAKPTTAPTESSLPTETLPTETLPSASPEGTGGVIEGFMEGKVIDPADVPDVVALLANEAAYKDMTVQSITYKLFEGRQAYYVVLMGEGEASHSVYVFADKTIADE